MKNIPNRRDHLHGIRGFPAHTWLWPFWLCLEDARLFFFFLIPASACLPFLPVYTLSSPASWSVSCHFTISPFLSCQLGVFQGDFSRKPKENKALKQNLVKPLKRHNFVQCRILKIVLSISGSMA